MGDDMKQIQAVAEAFVQHYYTTFDSDRSQMKDLYQASSKLTFAGDATIGAENIVKKLTALPFKSIAHQIKTLDFQPSGCGGIMVFVTGDFKADQNDAAKFSQGFHIMPSGPSSFWIHNDIFRIG